MFKASTIIFTGAARKTCGVMAPLFAAIAFALPASAQAEEEVQITVTGSREKQAEAAANQAKAVTPKPAGDYPLARHYAPLCVMTFGIDPNYGAVLVERVKANARRVGLAVDKEGCTPNVWIGFVRNSKEQVAQLRRTNPEMFLGMKQYEIDRIFSGSGAAQAWHATERRSEDGRPIPVVKLELSGQARPLEAELNNQYKAGRRSSAIRTDINGSLVVFDAVRANGLTVQQLADYATMRILAPVQDIARVEPGTVPSILTLFAEGADPRPDGLTEFDWAYLSAFYKLDRGARAASVHDATEQAMLDGTATGLAEQAAKDAN